MVKEYHMKLDSQMWNGVDGQSVNVMKMAVAARAEVDASYAALLQRAIVDNFTWLHFEPRAGARAFWGGSFSSKTSEWQGKNVLGRIMLQVARERSGAKSAPVSLSKINAKYKKRGESDSTVLLVACGST